MKFVWLLIVFALTAIAQTGFAGEVRLANRDVPTLDGQSIRLSDYQAGKTLVVAITNTTCPLCKKYAPRLAQIEAAYASRDVAFLYVNPSTLVTSEEATSMIKVHGFDGAYVVDRHSELVSELQAKTTTEVFVFSPERSLVYRGAVDDQYGLSTALPEPRTHYLHDALEALLSGKIPTISETPAPGCVLTLAKVSPSEKPSTVAAITYYGEIAHILQQKCNDCHRDGGVGPFPLTSVEQVLEHQGMIAHVLHEGLMPPWFADKEKSSLHFKNDMSLSQEQKTKLLGWLDSAHPLGDPQDAPQPKVFHADWQIGKPDLIVQLPEPVAIKAEGVMAYQHIVVDANFETDQWIDAVEIKPTDPSVVHHILVFAADKNSRVLRNRQFSDEDGFFAAYVPGNTFQTYPEGLARKIPAGSKFLFQVHYTPNGQATTDQTQMAIRFRSSPPEHMVRVTGISNNRISIPPNTAHHEQKASQKVPFDVKVLSFTPHMHLRGQAFRYEAVYPDERRVTLLEIPRYDFNWQLEYKLAEPLSLPAGSRIEVTGWYDNSSANASNPNPNKKVGWGPQTYDEMLIGYVAYYIEGEDPLKLPESPTENADQRRKLIEAAFKRFDKNGDEKLTREESDRPKLFERLDGNQDGSVDLEEAIENFPDRLELLKLMQERRAN